MFQMTYIPVASLAKELGTTSRGLMSALHDANIEVLGAFSEGEVSRGHIICVAEVARVGLLAR
jgi:hypothetical protein